MRLTPEAGLRKTHVLVVDDEELYRRSLERILRRVGHTVAEARDATEALNAVSEQAFDLVLVDLRMPGLNGIELVRQIRDVNPDLPCIVVTGFGSPESSVDALRAGAFWYLEKPFDQSNLDVIRKLVDQAIEFGRLRAENRILHSQLRSRYRFENIIGTSAALRNVLDMVAKVADTDSTVLVTGESGTGKELIAKAIHFNSRRADQPLITVNCGAIPEELLESELFGHEKGAFTGALRDREGRFEAANGGTIFLDEIGDMSPNLQVKLLRVLQDRSFERVGSSRTRRVDARVIAATNQNLEKAIREGRFREDLYFRLNVIPIEVPPLRSRREDIPQLAQHFLGVLNHERQTKVDSISPGAMAILCDYDWPGNVRQLEHLIERMTVLRGEGEIRDKDIPPLTPSASPSRARLQIPAEGINWNEVVGAFETDLIRQALQMADGNKAAAAALLGLHRTTLVEKIKKKGLEKGLDESSD
jgi:DNA-binding NtrC family response regulator